MLGIGASGAMGKLFDRRSLYLPGMPREKAVGLAIVKLLKDRGAWWAKTCPPMRPGVSDYLVCYRGRFVAMEAKNEDGDTTELQEYEMRRVRVAGGHACVVRSAQDAEVLLDQIDWEIECCETR